MGLGLGDFTNQGSVGRGSCSRLEDPGRAYLSFVSLQVTGRAALQNTTLQSLGLTGGSATIR